MKRRILADETKHALVVVAHPDDEMLWCGGIMLSNPSCSWHVVTLCRGDDPDRRCRFFRVMDRIGAVGRMGTLDDGPEQHPLSVLDIEKMLLSKLDRRRYDLILTHGPWGEYTRHRRHEEACVVVIDLWKQRALETDALWLFAYEDGNRSYYPLAIRDAHKRFELPMDILHWKRQIIRSFYGFSRDSWEYNTTPTDEAFWCFGTPMDATRWIKRKTPR